MPSLSEDEIREQVASGQICLLSIDTNIIDRYKHRLEHGLLKRLSQFANTEVKLVLSEIVVRELQSHMIQVAEGTADKYSTCLKHLAEAWNIPIDRCNAAAELLIGSASPEQLVQQRLENFQRSTGFIVVEVGPRLIIGDLLERYFAGMPPFGSQGKKKQQFPDAIALITLDRYAEEQGKLMLAVSDDTDWQEFAIRSRNLACVADLAGAMSYFQALPLVVCARLSERFRGGELPDLEEGITRALATFADGMDLRIEAASSYWYDHDLPEVEILDVNYGDDPIFVPVQQDEDLYVLELTVWADARVSCSFSFSVKDWVDKDYVQIGSNTVVAEVELPFSLTVTIQGDPEADFDLLDVEVIQAEKYVDFGEVGPDLSDPDF